MDKTIKIEIELELKEANINGQDIEFFEVNGLHNGVDLTFKVADKTTKKYLIKQINNKLDSLVGSGITPKKEVTK